MSRFHPSRLPLIALAGAVLVVLSFLVLAPNRDSRISAVEQINARTAAERQLLPSEGSDPQFAHCRVHINDNEIVVPRRRIGPPRFHRRLNTILNVENYIGEELFLYMDILGESFRRYKLQRKAWEWAMGLYALELMGKLNPKAVGLELAAGREPVMYYLSRRVAKLVGGDIYGHGGFASDGTAPGDLPSNPGKYATIPWDSAHLQAQYLDSTNLAAFANETFDFTISFSSIEHFGGEAAATRSMLEQARVLKPGGVAVVITELYYTGAVPGTTEYPFTAEGIERSLVKPVAARGLRLIEDIDMALSPTTKALFLTSEDPKCLDLMPHLSLCNRFGTSKWNCYGSIMLVFEKTGS